MWEAKPLASEGGPLVPPAQVVFCIASSVPGYGHWCSSIPEVHSSTMANPQPWPPRLKATFGLSLFQHPWQRPPQKH